MQATNLVNDYVSAWNHRDVSGIANLLTDNATYVDVPTHETLTVSALVDHLRRAFEREPFRYDLVGDILVGENTVAFRYNTYDLNSRPGSRPILSGAEFLVLHGDKFVRIDDYYSTHTESRENLSERSSKDYRPATKYRKSGLSADRAGHYRRRIIAAMERDRVYRQSDLTLPRLAEHVNCSATQDLFRNSKNPTPNSALMTWER